MGRKIRFIYTNRDMQGTGCIVAEVEDDMTDEELSKEALNYAYERSEVEGWWEEIAARQEGNGDE